MHQVHGKDEPLEHSVPRDTGASTFLKFPSIIPCGHRTSALHSKRLSQGDKVTTHSLVSTSPQMFAKHTHFRGGNLFV